LNNSKIEWTETTWNPVTGCTKVSSGCKNCYAEKMALRLHKMGMKKYKNGFEVTMHPDVLDDPCKLKTSKVIFVNSMSDLFHEDIPLEYIKKVFDVMNKCSYHVFQVLTKRSERMLDLSNDLIFTKNIWLGVTVEDNDNLHRIDDLLQIKSKIKFVSFEPLLSSLPDLDTTGIDWAIVGGESGAGARPIKEEWVLDIKYKCSQTNTSFFFKQWGGVNKKKNGRELQGEVWNMTPSFI